MEKGSSITWAPKNVRIMNVVILEKVFSLNSGLNLDEFFDLIRGRIVRIKILEIRARTPPSLLGIDRRIA